MALGYCPAILIHLAAVTGRAYPGHKVTEPGFTLMLYNQPNRPTMLQQAYQNGHSRTGTVKYKTRTTQAYVNNAISCDIDLTPAYKEAPFSADKTVQIGIYVSDADIRRYCDDASRMINPNGTFTGIPPSTMMAEHLDSILHAMNGLYQAMDNDLLTTMALNFGRNKNTGLTSARTINIPLNGTQNDLNTGIPRMLQDAVENEICGRPVVVGNGNFASWHNMKMANAISYNQSGIDYGALMPYSFFHDIYSASQWAINDIGVFEEGSVHIVENMQNVGDWGGPKPGASSFGIFRDPRTQCWSPRGTTMIPWDIQLKYIDCPTTFNNGYAGGTQTLGRGYAVFISKQYGLFTIPNDAYDGADIIAGQNGTLRFNITNT